MHAAHRHSHGHELDRGHDHHHVHAETGDKRYTIAIALNLSFVIVEAVAGVYANSTALFSDAAHNLSDVLGLALAGGAAWLARQTASERRTYGYAKATVLAALANALVLVAASGGIMWEAVLRFLHPEATLPLFMMVTAAMGVVVNGATAVMFVAGRNEDVNVRGAFLHMMGDAAVSVAVIVAGVVIWFTGWQLVDPAISVAVVLLILWTTWGILKESLDLAMDAAPAHIDVAAVRAYLAEQPGITAVHDLHIWAMGATRPALTAHLVRPEGGDDAFLATLSEGISQRFGIGHVTLQIERAQRDDCVDC
ncbi:MAG: cation transporter [Proteobacteria bacterium]|nr:cation transporter [Pseudomonadota bacterium]